ncbi:hypothetical protein GGI15_001583 [Coemansia interrupta]|uniref:FAD dependent oxidoreductase domain-containing protein n=1 Tax=Coemansia interrupta TaxID=1126814 RepID=A0A9W8HL00_9FUNG|nr:hypothetical protein GGI15_001583 [Coemansia interrupta]
MNDKIPVVVVGSGVIGLTTAVTLQRTQRYQVTVIGRDTPDDLHGPPSVSQTWASPFAGANWRAYSGAHEPQLRMAEEQTYFRLRDIAQESPKSGVKIISMADFGANQKERSLTPAFLDYVKNLQKIERKNWPLNAAFGYSYDSVIVNVLQYLPWLAAELRRLGGVICRATLDHISDALKYADGCSLIVNCSALGSATLGGVMDKNMYPVRGQTILVKAPHVNLTAMRPGETADKATYIIPRGNGTVILGGVFEARSNDMLKNTRTTDEILRNCLSMCPQLVGAHEPTGMFRNAVTDDDVEKLRKNILAVNVGFGPAREGGPRLDVQREGGVTIVHNYGQASYGFQTSWGYASLAMHILDAALSGKAKL